MSTTAFIGLSGCRSTIRRRRARRQTVEGMEVSGRRIRRSSYGDPHPLSSAAMHIERNELRCFHAVIDTGGFSRAAERLDLSQSAVSQTIANLEHRLGTTLLRRGSPPQPTEAGIRLLRFAEATLNEEREALADIGQIKSGALSTLSLALSPAANSRVGVALLKEFCERNPLTRLKVVVAPSREIVHGVGEGRWGKRRHLCVDSPCPFPASTGPRRRAAVLEHRPAGRRVLLETPTAIPGGHPLPCFVPRKVAQKGIRCLLASTFEPRTLDP